MEESTIVDDTAVSEVSVVNTPILSVFIFTGYFNNTII